MWKFTGRNLPFIYQGSPCCLTQCKPPSRATELHFLMLMYTLNVHAKFNPPLSLFFLLGKNEKKTPGDLVEVPERSQSKTEHVVCIWPCGALGRALRTLTASSHLLLGWKPTHPYGFFIPTLHLAVRLSLGPASHGKGRQINS